MTSPSLPSTQHALQLVPRAHGPAACMPRTMAVEHGRPRTNPPHLGPNALAMTRTPLTTATMTAATTSRRPTNPSVTGSTIGSFRSRPPRASWTGCSAALIRKHIPAQAVRSLLALKLIGAERKSHVMDLVTDRAIALFAGINVVPKRSYLAAYSSRIDHKVCAL